MKLAKGSWYLDEPIEVNGNLMVVFNNPRVIGQMYPVEFVNHVNRLENTVRKLLVELADLGVDLSTMYDVVSVINNTDGGA